LDADRGSILDADFAPGQDFQGATNLDDIAHIGLAGRNV
jgi:hypothetical protein